jgi:hypothetical protein
MCCISYAGRQDQGLDAMTEGDLAQETSGHGKLKELGTKC